MLRLGLIILVCAFITVEASGQNLPKLRSDMLRALNSKQVTDSLYTVLLTARHKQPLITAYLGCANALRAKHIWNPYFKLKYLKQGDEQFEAAVHQEPHNIEIRFLRFSVEHYLPGFLGYNKHLVIDRDEIVNQLHAGNYGTADVALTRTIIKFVLETKRATAAQEKFLHQQLGLIK